MDAERMVRARGYSRSPLRGGVRRAAAMAVALLLLPGSLAACGEDETTDTDCAASVITVPADGKLGTPLQVSVPAKDCAGRAVDTRLLDGKGEPLTARLRDSDSPVATGRWVRVDGDSVIGEITVPEGTQAGDYLLGSPSTEAWVRVGQDGSIHTLEQG